MTQQEKILNWLRDHPLIKINSLEAAAGIPAGVLAKSLAGSRGLPESYVEPLHKELKPYGYKR